MKSTKIIFFNFFRLVAEKFEIAKQDFIIIIKPIEESSMYFLETIKASIYLQF